MNEWLALGPLALAVCAMALFAGGFSKGAVGIGLPLVSVPLIATFVSVPKALALLTIPLFVTNIWQCLHGGHFPHVLRRFWPMALVLILGIGAGTQLLVNLDQRTLYLVMGLMVLVYPVLSVLNPAFRVPPPAEPWLGPVIALPSGMIGGMSGFFGPPLILFLAGLKLNKDVFTASVALIFLSGAVALSVFLAGHGILGRDDALASAAALAPALAGIYLGQRVRARISQQVFERALLVVLVLIGLNLLRRSLT
ncbi:MAG TPA: sulfite exporter TauE/SafE family protein [Pelomicrobium sp.]|nr:sulfite exporter TauE/SafE family protein [Pelomicrobium sp.]